jgi:hypothetical protein
LEYFLEEEEKLLRQNLGDGQTEVSRGREKVARRRSDVMTTSYEASEWVGKKALGG